MITELERRLTEFVDRESEINAFSILIESDEKPILIVWGDDGIGKSSLLARMIHECAQRKVAKAEVVCTEIRNQHYLDIMRKIRDDIGGDYFQSFNDLVNYLTEPGYELKIKVESTGSISVGQNMKIGGNSTVNSMAGVIIKDSMISMPRSDQAVPESERIIRLSDQFIKNLSDATKDKVLVVFFDGTEKMTDITHNWICEELFRAVTEGRLPNIRFVFCGSKCPMLDRNMKLIVEQTELQPLQLTDIVHYLAKRGVEEIHRIELAKLLLVTSKGKPSDIATYVDGFLMLQEKGM